MTSNNKEKDSMNFTCNYCKSSFKSSTNLKVHQKTAKFCLKIQNKPIEGEHKCEFCNKDFSLKSHLISHISVCKEKKTIDNTIQNETYIKRIKDLENQVKQKDNIVSKLNGKLSLKDEIIKKLEKQIKELLNRPTTINNNNDNRQQNQYNIQFNKLFENLPILNEENVNNRLNELSTVEKINQYDLNQFYKGALENIIYQLKDLSFCTDPSRKMVVIKDESEKSVKLNAEEFLSKSFTLGSESIKNHITFADQIVNERVDNNDPHITIEMLDHFNDDRDKFIRRMETNQENFFLSSNNTNNKIESGIVSKCIKQLEKCNK